NERELLRMLKETGVYFSIRFIEGDPDQLYASLQPRREKRSDAGVTYNKYFFDTATISRLIKENGVDAVALMVVSGINRRDKISSGNLLSTLEADYNELILTAQIIDAEGTVLWEYPNFKKRNPNIPPLLRLQYPDFDEAEANETDKVEVKFKTVAGIGRALQRKDKDMLRRETRLSYRYSIVFDDMLSLLNPSNGLMGGKKKSEATEKPAGEGR
ncbi:MAG TPA: hypothetical protein VFR01_01225, partial [Geobacterales bacterium]|nr:hypothetical protein [Geobacterales bacterium]